MNRVARLEKRGGAKQFIVDHEPFLVLGGELFNSSSSSSAFMAPIWPRLKALNLNTVLASVSWEMIEPTEGAFDFAQVDALIADARKHGMRLVIVYFGTWKNATSSYVPAWVKGDTTRFFRACDGEGKRLHCISPFCEEAMQGNARAFEQLMAHICSVDRDAGTVIAAQVENEVGLLGTSRDMCDVANQAFLEAVPTGLIAYLRTHRDDLLAEVSTIWANQGCLETGTWEGVFGTDADEVFTAWHMARFVEVVAQAGKNAHPIPYFTNAWLVQSEGQKAGEYPSGGPVSRMQDIWRAAAPTIAFLAPDIYSSNFREVCASYTRGGNPLFIPEARRCNRSASTSLYAFGKHAALGFSPFGIDKVEPDHPLKETYAFLANTLTLVTTAQQEGRCTAFLQQHDQEVWHDLIGGIYVRAATTQAMDSDRVPGGAIVIALEECVYLVAGRNLHISFHADEEFECPLEFLRCEEGVYHQGVWTPGRLLNGDETRHGLLVRLGSDFLTCRVTVSSQPIKGKHIEWIIPE